MVVDKSQPELVEYTFTYNGKFIRFGSVEFRYRSYSKLMKGLTENGVFRFYIDGID